MLSTLARVPSLKHLHKRIHIKLTVVAHSTIQRDIGGNYYCSLNLFLSRTRRTDKSRMCRNAVPHISSQPMLK